MTRYKQWLAYGFGSQEWFDRILVVGCEQYTAEDALLTSKVREALIAGRTSLKNKEIAGGKGSI